MQPDFTIVLRGYDRPEVDAFLTKVERATTRPASVPEFHIALRGYERRQVDVYIERLLAALPDRPEPTAHAQDDQGSEPERCTKCAAAAEHGYFEFGARFRWIGEQEADGAPEARVLFSSMTVPRVPALRCESCRTVWFTY
jgi:DivIVA domain-containing protein